MDLSKASIMDWAVFVFPPNFYIDALTPNITVFGERAFKDIIKGK